MIHRRFLLYFLILSAFTVVATVAFEVYSFRRAIDHTLQQNLLFARSVARVVGGLLDEEGQRLDGLLADATGGKLDAKALQAKVSELRGATLDGDGVALLDDKRQLLAGDVLPAGLPPPEVLLPAVRKAEQSGKLVVTDLWQGIDDKPRVALVRTARNGEVRRAVVTYLRLDGKDFQRIFSYFLVHDRSRLQLLDSSGVALFSTRPAERFRSVVHGTYFTDKVRLGTAVQMPCHSCHENGEAEPVRENEVTTVAPLPGTDWSVTVREDTEALFAPMTETVYTSSVLVSLIFGAFVGFYFLLSRRVLRPMRQLAETATAIAATGPGGQDAPGPRLQDELALVARSFEAMRARTSPTTLAPVPPLPDLPVSRMPASATTVDPTELVATLRALVAGVANCQAVRSALLLVRTGPDDPGHLALHGLTVRGDGPLVPQLEALVGDRTQVGVQELAARGFAVEGAGDTRTFYVQRLQVLGRLQGQLWIGMPDQGEELARYLRPTLGLVGSQVQSLLERTLLYEQLRHEQEHKDRMLRHLFDAEAEERKRLAREIHDETAQELTALSLLLETATGPERNPGLDKAKSLVGEILDGLQRLVRRLRPALLDDMGLVEAVRATAQNLLEASGIAVELELEGDDVPVPREVENAVYRVFQEAVTNVARHAGARKVRIVLRIGAERIAGAIEDDGRGLDASLLADDAARPRWGLLGMRERVLQLGGTIDFGKAGLGGLRVAFEVPFGVEPAA